jgi:hypothetical protein
VPNAAHFWRVSSAGACLLACYSSLVRAASPLRRTGGKRPGTKRGSLFQGREGAGAFLLRGVSFERVRRFCEHRLVCFLHVKAPRRSPGLILFAVYSFDCQTTATPSGQGASVESASVSV